MENSMVKHVVPLQPMEDHIGADSYTAAGGDALKEAAAHKELVLVPAPGRNCRQWGTHVFLMNCNRTEDLCWSSL